VRGRAASGEGSAGERRCGGLRGGGGLARSPCGPRGHHRPVTPLGWLLRRAPGRETLAGRAKGRETGAGDSVGSGALAGFVCRHLRSRRKAGCWRLQACRGSGSSGARGDRQAGVGRVETTAKASGSRARLKRAGLQRGHRRAGTGPQVPETPI